MTDFGSLLTASITPFDSQGVLNTDTLWRLCRKLVHDIIDINQRCKPVNS